MTAPGFGDADLIAELIQSALGIEVDPWQRDVLRNVFHPSRQRWHDLNDARCAVCRAPQLCPHCTAVPR